MNPYFEINEKMKIDWPLHNVLDSGPNICSVVSDVYRLYLNIDVLFG